MWTFESDHQVSKQHYANLRAATKAMMAWVEICAANDFYPEVKLVPVTE